MMINILWNDIQIQAENLHKVIQYLYGPERQHLEEAAHSLQNDRPIVFIGVASAAYLCMPAEFYLGQQGRPASTVYASDALYTLLPMLRNSNVVINSRSGETVEIVKLVQALRAEVIPFVLITNEPESSAASLADHCIWANSHKDDLVSINIVTAMMTTTLILAAAVMGQLDILKPEFDRLPGLLDGMVKRCSSQADQIYLPFKNVRPIHLLYRSFGKAAAYLGRLVLEEVARTPGVPLEAAEFRQGPNEVVDERFGAAVFVPGGHEGKLNQSLAKDLLSSGGKIMLVGDLTGWDGKAEVACSISGVPDFMLPVLQVVPLQILAYKLAEGQGYTPGQVRYISKVILTEEGIPNQG
jgi:glutamine---fructose-6-phosphate transaminase (isomerizing)